jgi:hypothetical protein
MLEVAVLIAAILFGAAACVFAHAAYRRVIFDIAKWPDQMALEGRKADIAERDVACRERELRMEEQEFAEDRDDESNPRF